MLRNKMMKTVADSTIIGTGTITHVWLQTFNLTLSAVIGLLTILYTYIRIRNELKDKKKKDDSRDI